MWFKNLVVYRLPADWSLSAAELEEKLGTRPLQPCSPFEMLSRGFVAPSSTGRLVHTVNQQHLIALGEWSDEQQQTLHEELVELVRAAGKESEAHGTLHDGDRPSVKTMFEDVYKEMDWRLIRQRQELGI